MKTAVAEARAHRRRRRRTRRPRSSAGPWSVGIVGLVAARLAEDRGRPAVVGADLGDVDPRVVPERRRRSTSAPRSSAARDLFTRYGGHAGAAGFELPAERWDAFRERFLALAARRRAAPTRGSAARSTSRCRPLDVDYALLPRARRPRAVRARATRIRSSPSSASP